MSVLLRKWMNLPNSITLARILLVPVCMVALLERIPAGELWAAALFTFAAVTDGVDGYIARRWRQVTVFGKLMDPLADKLLVAGALVALVELQSLTSWVVIAILGREFAVTGLRALAAAEGAVIPASPLGKVKTVLQVVAIVLIILSRQAALAWFGPVAPLIPVLAPWALAAALAVTIWSGLEYGWRYLQLVEQRP